MKYTPKQVERMIERKGCMSVCTQPGMQIVFARFNAGYDIEKEEVKRLGLKIGRCYTVADISVGRSSTSLTLKEFPGHSFNSVFFCNKPRQKLPQTIHNFGYSSPWVLAPLPRPQRGEGKEGRGL